MIDRICGHIHNYFEAGRQRGTYTIKGGTLQLDGLQTDQYFRIIGSAFNDGVYQYPACDLRDETFTGEIRPMRPPKAFLELVQRIEAWQEKYGEIVNAPYQSESVIGVYSYTRGSGASWESTFAGELNRFRKLG